LRLLGNNAVQGHPAAADDIASGHLNAFWKSAPLPAHAFNFGFVTAHAVKDMLIVHESPRYRPDVIVYGAIRSHPHAAAPGLSRHAPPERTWTAEDHGCAGAVLEPVMRRWIAEVRTPSTPH